MIGNVKWFDSDRGYGFICVPGRQDIFVHCSDIVVEGPCFLVPGEAVQFQISPDGKGRERAVGVRVIRRSTQARQELLAEMPSLEGIEDGVCTGCGCPVMPGAPHCGACGARFPRRNGDLPHQDSYVTYAWDAEAGARRAVFSVRDELGARMDNITALAASFAK